MAKKGELLHLQISVHSHNVTGLDFNKAAEQCQCYYCPLPRFLGPDSPGDPLDISVRKQAEVQVIKLRGSLKLGQSVDEFKALLDELLQSNDTSIVLSLAEVPIIDSSGIGVLVRSLTSAKQGGGSIKLVQPSKMVVQTLKMVGTWNLFESFESDEEAVQSFS
jgi:anti-sigma B factor antagonist